MSEFKKDFFVDSLHENFGELGSSPEYGCWEKLFTNGKGGFINIFILLLWPGVYQQNKFHNKNAVWNKKKFKTFQ